MQPLALEAEALAFGCPRKLGQKKEIQKCLTYMLSRIGFELIRSPTVESLEHGLCFRPQWSEWPENRLLEK